MSDGEAIGLVLIVAMLEVVMVGLTWTSTAVRVADGRWAVRARRRGVLHRPGSRWVAYYAAADDPSFVLAVEDPAPSIGHEIVAGNG